MQTVAASRSRAPSEIGVWAFIFGDLCIFALFFFVFLYDKSLQPALFAESQATLVKPFGAFNMLVLLLSSWLMARAVHAARRCDTQSFQRDLQRTMLCGFTFLCVKVAEYSGKLSSGYHLDTNDFFRDYFVFTGYHMLHVIIGLSLLWWINCLIKTPAATESHITTVESVGLYWHMVDLLWVVLFALIYLTP
jgi:nitric oxide reductase NorE protein